MSESWSGAFEIDEPGGDGDLPTTGADQSCAFCGSGDVAWAHPLRRDQVSYEQYGKGCTLPTFWTLCGECESLYRSGDDEAVVAVMHSSAWDWVEAADVEECIGKPLAVFRRADQGARPLSQ